MFSEPLAGWRHVEVTDRRTKKDYAHQLKSLVDIYHPEAEKITVIHDNLNTHVPYALPYMKPLNPKKPNVSSTNWIFITPLSMVVG
jgi:hypothetical protein